MKAVMKTRQGEGAEYCEIERPTAADGEVLVRVKFAAICGTDVHIYQWNDWARRTIPALYGDKPRVMGHEFCGEVVEVGAGVTKVKPGDRVAGETHIACGRCFLCRTGSEYNCQNLTVYRDGVFAEYAVIPEYGAEVVPAEVPDEIAALFEPFGVAVQAASAVRLVGDSVAVVGAGPIGLFAIIMAKVMGATTIFATDISAFRLDLARRLGADHVLNPKDVDVVRRVQELTDGLGAGIVIETSGNARAAKQGFEMLRRCGSYLMIGLPSEPLILDAGADIVWKGAKVHGIYGRENFRSWEIAKQLLATKRVDLSPVITARFAFRDYKQAFDLCETGESGKVLLLPE